MKTRGNKISRFPLETFKKRFWNKVNIIGPNECWLWNGGTDGNGYGSIRFRKRKDKAHRVSYWIANGDPPKGLEICHSCNTPACVNPKHLYVATRLQNQRDSWKRGVRTGPKAGCYGELSPNHKLTREQATKIFIMVKARGMTQTNVARLLGLDQSTVSDIIRKNAWKPVLHSVR